MATEIILLEKVEKLGKIGDLVKVKPGYARNYLLPQNKALRATTANIAYFESIRKQLEKVDGEKKSAAEKTAKKVNNVKVIIIRQASESGHLYGSVNSRDIAEAIKEKTSEEIMRNQIVMNDNYKETGLFEVEILLHPEVKVNVVINIARTEEEAVLQEKAEAKSVADEAKAEAKEKADAAKAVKAETKENDKSDDKAEAKSEEEAA